MGYGTVGSGVVEVISANSFKKKAGEGLCVKAILDIRDFADSPFSNLFTKDFNVILNDCEIDIVVETIGGISPAFEFTKSALESKKSVVTSNKELVAAKGAELIKTARENGVSYLFEASVGGGIPIIRPLNNCLAANEIYEITGILNGTTNYILTQMAKSGQSFKEALAAAQEKGYAEQDPSDDIEGVDTCRKIAILSALSYGKQLESDKIPTKGITNITLKDILLAKKAGYAIKLIGKSKKTKDGVYAFVSPLLLPEEHPLAGVEDVFNAIVVQASATGDVMFYGKGAGKMPTASAVVADCIDIIKHNNSGGPTWEDGGVLTVVNPDDVKYFIHIQHHKNEDIKNLVDKLFKGAKWVEKNDDDIAFITDKANEKDILNGINELKKGLGDSAALTSIRVEG